MAEQEQVQRLGHSIEEWNRWRQQQPNLLPNLHDAYLGNAYLRNADLYRAYLRGADLSRANLSRANLGEANLSEADLSSAYLSKANLGKADLSKANLSETNFSYAYVSKANLSETNLSKANLNYADLSNANLSKANLNGANLSNVRFNNTTFAWVDLSCVKGLETAFHTGPSTVNINSVTLPHDEHTLLHFLRGVGFSDTFIDYLPSLLTIPIQYHSLFLSHSHHDQDFTKRLHTDLQSKGIRCWFAPHDLQPGTPIVRGIEEAIHQHEKLLLILSKDAVISNWVQQEVEVALYKEVTTGQEILFPIRLDNTVLESNTPWAKRLRQRHLGDFINWQDDVAYQQAFTTLLRHLKVDRLPTLL